MFKFLQIIGYIQRHLPACLLQAFAQGIYKIVDNKEKLNRDFKFKYDGRPAGAGPVVGDLNNLGYKWACGVLGVAPLRRGCVGCRIVDFSKIIANKKSGLENLRGQSHNGNASSVTYRPCA